MMGLRVLAVLAMLAAPVFAQPKPSTPPTAAQKQQVQDLIKRAIAKSQAGDHDGAIKDYLDAYAIVPLPILLSNVGAAFKQLKKPVDALKYFCMYLDKDPTGTNATYVTAEAKNQQAELGLDTTEACPKPKEPVKPVKVEPPPIALPVEPVVRKTTPISGIVITDPPPPRDSGGTVRLVGLSLVGAGVVSLGAGTFFGFKAKHNSDLISNHDPNEEWPSNIKEIEEDGKTFEKNQIVLTAIGGALVATGVIVYFVGRSKKSESAISVVPTATPSTVGVSLSRGF
ncbi:MAG: hypothetical protein ABI867_09515 [Kofleriaceae bacterium]